MDADQTAPIAATSANKARQIQVLQRESQAYYDFSVLIHAVKALNDWRQVEDEFANKKDRPKSVPGKIKKAFEATKDAIEHVLQGVLMEAKDGEHKIRSRNFDLELTYTQKQKQLNSSKSATRSCRRSSSPTTASSAQPGT